MNYIRYIQVGKSDNPSKIEFPQPVLEVLIFNPDSNFLLYKINDKESGYIGDNRVVLLKFPTGIKTLYLGHENVSDAYVSIHVFKWATRKE